jgi:hypothetical protein
MKTRKHGHCSYGHGATERTFCFESLRQVVFTTCRAIMADLTLDQRNLQLMAIAKASTMIRITRSNQQILTWIISARITSGPQCLQHIAGTCTENAMRILFQNNTSFDAEGALALRTINIASFRSSTCLGIRDTYRVTRAAI